MWSFVSVPRYPSILSVPPEERRKGGICGGGIPLHKGILREFLNISARGGERSYECEMLELFFSILI